jgi:hypothetical protein
MRSGLLTAAFVSGALALAGCGSSSSTSSQAAASTSSTTTSTAAATTPTTSTAANGGTGTVPAPAPGPIGPEGIPLQSGPELAPASSTVNGTTVDGIQCAPVEQLAYHIHAHLQVYVNGQSRSLPGAIGMVGPVAQQTPNGPFYSAQTCIYWLHTHTSDGIIHIESPTARIYTLGNFFNIWHQPLSSSQVATASGRVSAFVNGKPWTGDPRMIPLRAHAQVQLDVGSPNVAYAPISFAGTSL